MKLLLALLLCAITLPALAADPLQAPATPKHDRFVGTKDTPPGVDPAFVDQVIADSKARYKLYPKPATPPMRAVFNRKDDAYYNDPWHPGRHWSCKDKSEGVAYENNEIIVMCEGLVEYKVHRGVPLFKKMYRVTEKVEKIYCKGGFPNAAGETCDEVAQRNFWRPFYDSRERGMVLANGVFLGADLLTTGLGIAGGACHEGNPIARAVPGLSVGVAVFGVVSLRHTARQTPRYYTTSRSKADWAPAVTHGAAALHNLYSCVL